MKDVAVKAGACRTSIRVLVLNGIEDMRISSPGTRTGSNGRGREPGLRPRAAGARPGTGQPAITKEDDVRTKSRNNRLTPSHKIDRGGRRKEA